MTRGQVEAAVRQAARQAFASGVRFGRTRQGREHEQLAAAVQYAEQLVLPMVDLAMDEAGEQAATRVLRRRAQADALAISAPDGP